MAGAQLEHKTPPRARIPKWDSVLQAGRLAASDIGKR
jgi:hypothetical protein